ncbi:Aste57867_22089 [Aphanomyces stellatus]|uniref:Aste57867_22089 protein n=1 Tax=Aphanomyces stellatus TaxID=120398 RepID=A0A485LJH1_9STRA|nr:hypothetical protein As57867_022020 [Aphanomyces stellatus]VFT98757.1 Aste57867_22089 [Aphanomyces stellatus]
MSSAGSSMGSMGGGFTNLSEVGTPNDDTKSQTRSSTPSKGTERHKKKGNGHTRRLLPLDLSSFDLTQKSKRIFQKKALALHRQPR